MPGICRILFVCTGNTCRSVLADAFFRRQWAGEGVPAKNVRSSSAGLAAAGGAAASSEVLALLRDEGLSMDDHRARLVDAGLLATADYIFTMTAAHKEYILGRFPRYKNKVWILDEFGGGGFDIPDPYGRGKEAYRQAADRIKQALASAIARLKNELAGCGENQCK